MSRSNSPRAAARRQVLTHVKAVRDALTWTQNRWTVAGRIADPVSEGGRVVTHTWRDRRPEEYPEASAAEWAELYRYAGEMIDRLAVLQQFAAQQWRATDLPKEQARP